MLELYEKYTVPLMAGGIANVGGVVTSLGPLYFAFRKQSKTPALYVDLFKEFNGRAGWARAYKALVPSIKMAPLQSFGYSSVVIYSTESYKKSINPNDPSSVKVPLQVAARAGFYSALTETILSVYHLKKMFDHWNLVHLDHSMSPATFSRVFMMTLVKNSIANPLTVVGVFGAKLQLDQLLDDQHTGASVCERSPQLSAVAGFAGALGANLVFAPVVTLQTRVLETPQITISSQIRQLWGEGAKAMWAGVGARSVAKAVQASVGFGLVPILVSALKINPHGFFSSVSKPPKLPELIDSKVNLSTTPKR